jgi:hypothetical protein
MEHWTVATFGEDGRLVEGNKVWARQDLTPLRLLSVSPLRVGFGHERDGRLIETADAVSLPEWQTYTQALEHALQKAAQEMKTERRGSK